MIKFTEMGRDICTWYIPKSDFGGFCIIDNERGSYSIRIYSLTGNTYGWDIGNYASFEEVEKFIIAAHVKMSMQDIVDLDMLKEEMLNGFEN